jgi:hypothetical protein
MGLLEKATEFSTPRRQKLHNDPSVPKATGDKKKSDTWLGPTDIGMFESGPVESTAGKRTLNHGSGGLEGRIPDIHALLWNAGRIENDLQAPAEVFALLVREFQAKKAALLVLGHDRMYLVPYSLRGYDETTEHRLRILYPRLAESVSSTEGYALLDEGKLESFKPYFSNREFSLVSKILLVPFMHGEDITAVFVTTDCPALSSSAIYSIDFATLSRDLGELIHHSRNITLDRLTGADVRSRSEVLSSIRESIDLIEGSENKLTFFLISLGSFLDLLHREAELVEPYRLREDTIRIISSMMPDSVNVFAVDQHVLLIIMPGKFHVNIPLLVHQIKVGLQTLFKITQTSIDLAEASFEYPSDASTSQEIIERIFSYSGEE